MARISPALAQRLGATEGQLVTVSAAAGWYTMPVAISDDMVDEAVWLPTNSPGTGLGELAVVFGDDVTLSLGGEE